MHEAEPTSAEILKGVNEGLDVLNETLMACMVQLSRIYDILAVEHYAKRSRYGDEAAELLNGHERGDIHTTAPVLRSFGAPDSDPLTDGEEDDS